MSIKLIATDMDGTFLNDKGTYDRDKFLKLLDQLDQRDIRFVVASGNNMDRLNLIFKGLTGRMSFVAENGAHIVEAGKTLQRHQLAKKDVALFLDYFKDKLVDYAVILSTEEVSYLHKNACLPKFTAIDPEQFEQFFLKMKEIDDFTGIEEENILKISMMLPIDDCQEVITTFNQNFSGNLTAVTSGFGAVDIIQTGIHKAWGLKKLMEAYQVTADQLMAFGDGENDIEMLELAHFSYAMANAPASVKSVAHFIAPHHSQGGVLQVLEQFLTSTF
ncbi:Cof-type HAD-IIB family hydrolase [Streptococcus castoreus]|uniref:Cof-type HAD-IIB family hydrolase n=1 Tax=Streptococcus castoreus TaxID=254786 RepID=UPI000426F3F7|nr:Cof-type HAD-IIB family hydrolase [Streptococcus castoreus]